MNFISWSRSSEKQQKWRGRAFIMSRTYVRTSKCSQSLSNFLIVILRTWCRVCSLKEKKNIPIFETRTRTDFSISCLQTSQLFNSLKFWDKMRILPHERIMRISSCNPMFGVKWHQSFSGGFDTRAGNTKSFLDVEGEKMKTNIARIYQNEKSNFSLTETTPKVCWCLYNCN